MGRVTIPARWPSSAALSDYASTCDICGVPWRRSQLRYDTRGFLVCPNHGDGLDPAELSRLNAESAEQWAAELASRPPRDRPMDQVHIGRDPRVIFAARGILFDADAEEATANASGYVTSLADANGGAFALTPSSMTGFLYRQEDQTLDGRPVLILRADSGSTGAMRAATLTSALPVCYWGLIKVSRWSVGDPIVRGVTANPHSCTFATGSPAQTFTVRDGVAPTLSVLGPGQGGWFRMFARFSSGEAELRIGPLSMTENVGSLPLDGLEMLAIPGGNVMEFNRFVVLSAVPTEAELTEADDWVRTRIGGNLVSL